MFQEENRHMYTIHRGKEYIQQKENKKANMVKY